MEFGRLETSVVVNTTTDSRELGNVEKVDECVGIERNRPVELLDGVVSLLEIVCVADVAVELENEGSLTALEDAVVWIEPISVVDATIDDVCEEVECELELLSPAGLFGIAADEKAEKLADKLLVEANKKIDWEEWPLNSDELCEMLAGEDVDNLGGDTTAIDDKTGGKVEDSEALADNTVVDVAIEETAELAEEVTDLFIVEEAIECIVETAEKVIEESGVEVAIG